MDLNGTWWEMGNGPKNNPFDFDMDLEKSWLHEYLILFQLFMSSVVCLPVSKTIKKIPDRFR